MTLRRSRPQRSLEESVRLQVVPLAGETLVAAVSGGADSVALAALLAGACALAGATLVIGHVNHGVRERAYQDEAVTLAVGAALGVRVAVAALPPGGRDEARLRDERYVALLDLARACGARRVFTGHHAADQTETVLLALFRGTGSQGLRGMPERRPLGDGVVLERPLLREPPARLRAYCGLRHLPYAVDPTNDGVGYRRGAVRSALAELRASFPGLDAAVARHAELHAAEAAPDETARARANVRSLLRSSLGETRDVDFGKVDAAARAIVQRRTGRFFVRRGVEVIVHDAAPEPNHR